MPIQGAGGAKLPAAWSTLDQTIVDVSSIMGTDGKPVEAASLRRRRPIRTRATGTLPSGSLTGKIALASRGICTFASKADRAKRAGAIGLILVDNRFGEANPIPIRSPLPAGMISDLDGSLLRGYASQHGGQATIRVSSDIREIQTGPQRRDHELLVRRPDRLRLVPEARHLGARARRPLVHAAADDRLDVLRLRRHVDGDAARRRRRRAARAAASELDAARRSSLR